VDLDQVASGHTPEKQLLGSEEIAIVQQVRWARTQADEAFRNQENASKVSSALALSASLGGEKATMPQNPVPRKRVYNSVAQLKEQMEAWAKGNLVEHRGQRFSYERFEKEAKQSPEMAQQIVEAASELLAESNDPRVLVMVAQLGDNTKYRPFYEAVLGRLETAVPDAKGIRSGTLRDDLIKRLADRLPATDPELSPRAHTLLKREGRQDIRLAMLNYSDPNKESIDVLAAVCQSPANPSLIANAVAHIASRQPERLLEAVSQVSQQSEKARALAYAEIHRATPQLAQQQDEDLRKTLGLK
jgi:hypothetical protein